MTPLGQAPFVSSWWLAWLAAGAAAAAIPVVIHLIHTARAPQVPFPTLRFLKSAAEKTARRRRLENILLLILRMLLFAVLAWALARPFLSEEFGLFAAEGRGAAVIVLDNSYSMNVSHGGRTRLSAAKAEAREVLDSRFKPARAAVLLTNPGPDPVPDDLTADRARLFQRIDRAEVSSARADLPGTLKKAYALLAKADAAEKRLWILTDRQALSWQGLADLGEPAEHRDVPVAVIRPTEPSYTNVAVADARITSRSRVVGMPVRLEVTARNAAPGPEKRNLLLFVDDFGQARHKEPVELTAAGTPGSTRTVAMTHVFERPGPHRVLVAFEGTDSLALDNSRRIAAQVADRIPVLLVKERHAEVPFQDADYYLVRSLDPIGAGGDFPWAIRPSETTADNLDPGAIANYAAVFVNDIRSPTADLAEALADYVASGRTLVVFLGPNANMDAYNNRLVLGLGHRGGLLPARLKARIGDAVLKNEVQKVTMVRERSPYLEGLVDSAEIYQGVLVYEYYRTEGEHPDAVLARLDGGDPFLLHKPFGRGHVLMCTTTATTDWTNFPVRNLFLPLMMRVVHLAARGDHERANLLAGQTFETNLYPEVAEPVTAEITGPLGPAGEPVTEQTETVAADGRNLLRFEKTWNLGYYAYRVPQRAGVEGVFATNADGGESDLSEIDEETLRREIGARETHVASGFSELVRRFESTARRELWQYFLIGCLCLAVLEPLVANWLRPDRRATAHPTPASRAAAA